MAYFILDKVLSVLNVHRNKRNRRQEPGRDGNVFSDHTLVRINASGKMSGYVLFDKYTHRERERERGKRKAMRAQSCLRTVERVFPLRRI